MKNMSSSPQQRGTKFANKMNCFLFFCSFFLPSENGRRWVTSFPTPSLLHTMQNAIRENFTTTCGTLFATSFPVLRCTGPAALTSLSIFAHTWSETTGPQLDQHRQGNQSDARRLWQKIAGLNSLGVHTTETRSKRLSACASQETRHISTCAPGRAHHGATIARIPQPSTNIPVIRCGRQTPLKKNGTTQQTQRIVRLHETNTTPRKNRTTIKRSMKKLVGDETRRDRRQKRSRIEKNWSGQLKDGIIYTGASRWAAPLCPHGSTFGLADVSPPASKQNWWPPNPSPEL